MGRAETTLFLLSSIDGKISTGFTDVFDFDRDLPNIPATKQGLIHYYRVEKELPPYTIITGRVLQKIGATSGYFYKQHINATFIVLDKGYMNFGAIKNMAENCNGIIYYDIGLKCSDDDLAAYGQIPNVRVHQQAGVHAEELLRELKEQYKIDHVAIQCGGNMNRVFAKEHCIDHVHVFIAPIIVGGKNTPTMVDGSDISMSSDILDVNEFKLESVMQYSGSYVELKYERY